MIISKTHFLVRSLGNNMNIRFFNLRIVRPARRFLIVACYALACLAAFQTLWAQQDRAGVQIFNLKQTPMKGMTHFDTGPCVGEILNAHFYPGLEEYLDGNYANAVAQMDYFIARPQYTEMNPKQAEYFSIAHYIRGSIFLEHARGTGRYALAINDFEASIRWNKHNYQSYLKLATACKEAQLKDRAISTLKMLLDMNLPEQIREEAATMLRGFVAEKSP